MMQAQSAATAVQVGACGSSATAPPAAVATTNNANIAAIEVRKVLAPDPCTPVAFTYFAS
jgi:hypothetical protein